MHNISKLLSFSLAMIFIFACSVAAIAFTADSTALLTAPAEVMQETAQNVVSEVSIGTFLLNGIVGMVIFYITKTVQAIKVFDLTYWWNDNKISFIANLTAISLVAILNSYNPDLLNTVLGLLGIVIDTTEGAIGTISFFTILSGIVYEIIKKMRGKGQIITDGKGNPLSAA